jgi:hypothetical protein
LAISKNDVKPEAVGTGTQSPSFVSTVGVGELAEISVEVSEYPDAALP